MVVIDAFLVVESSVVSDTVFGDEDVVPRILLLYVVEQLPQTRRIRLEITILEILSHFLTPLSSTVADLQSSCGKKVQGGRVVVDSTHDSVESGVAEDLAVVEEHQRVSRVREGDVRCPVVVQTEEVGGACENDIFPLLIGTTPIL